MNHVSVTSWDMTSTWQAKAKFYPATLQRATTRALSGLGSRSSSVMARFLTRQGVLVIHKKNQNTGTCSNRDGSGKHRAKGKKPNTMGHM